MSAYQKLRPVRAAIGFILLVALAITTQAAPLQAAPALPQAKITPTPAPVNGNISLVIPDVKLQPDAGEEIALSLGVASTLQAGTRITVSQAGEALLSFPPVLAVRLFRDVAIQREATLDPNAPFLVSVQLFAGAIFGKESPQLTAEKIISIEVSTGWALIRPTGTQFWVYFNPASQVTWVIVKEGKVEVTAAGTTVTVLARQQTWVQPAEPPVNPIPARRALIGNLFPSVASLTNGALTDADLLEPAPATPTPAATNTPTPTPTRRRVVATRIPVRITRVVPPVITLPAPPAPPPVAVTVPPPPPQQLPPIASVPMGVKPNPVPYGGTAQVWWVIPAEVFRSGSFDKGDGRGFIGPVGNSFVVNIPNMTESRTVYLRWQDVNGGAHEQALFIPVSAQPQPDPLPSTPTPFSPTPTPYYTIPTTYVK